MWTLNQSLHRKVPTFSRLHVSFSNHSSNPSYAESFLVEPEVNLELTHPNQALRTELSTIQGHRKDQIALMTILSATIYFNRETIGWKQGGICSENHKTKSKHKRAKHLRQGDEQEKCVVFKSGRAELAWEQWRIELTWSKRRIQTAIHFRGIWHMVFIIN